MPPTSKAKPSRKATKPKPAIIKRTLPEYATALEKEKALIPDTKRCKSPRDAKKNVDKAIYDNFRSLSNYQIHIEIRDGFTLFRSPNSVQGSGRSELCDHGQNYYCELCELYSGDLVAIVSGDQTDSKDFLVRDVLIAMRRHCSDPGVRVLGGSESSPRNLCALLRGTLQIDPYVCKTNCEVIVSVLEWCHRVEFCTLQLKMFQEMVTHFDKEKEWYGSVLPSMSFILPEAAS